MTKQSFSVLNRRPLATLACCFLLHVAAVHPVDAAQFRIDNTTGVELSWDVACDGTNYLAAILGDELGNNNITAQRFSSAGAAVSSRIRMGRTGNVPGGLPVVAFGSTNYLVAWQDNGATGERTYAQRVSVTGTLQGSAIAVASRSSAALGFAPPGVAYGASEFLVVWNDDRSGNYDVYGRMVSPDGTLGSEIAIATGTQKQCEPAVAYDGTKFLVVWEHQTSTSRETWDVYGTLVTSSGTAGPAFKINQVSSPSFNPTSVAFDGLNFLVVWHRDVNDGSPNPNEWDLHGRLVTMAGAVTGEELDIATEPGSQAMPRMACGGGGTLVVWSDGLFDGGTYTARGRFFDRAGQPLGEEFEPFSAVGAGNPMLAGVGFDGTAFMAVGAIGVFNGTTFQFTSGDVYGVVLRAGSAPSIVDSPASRTDSVGSTATFSVTADGTEPLCYQWRKNGADLVNGGNVSGVTTTNLTLANVQTSDAGNYTVLVTNDYGSVTSSVAVLTVGTPAPFTWARRVASTVNPNAELSIGMTLDGQGDCYVTGWFDGTNDFGGLIRASLGAQDIFVAKYASNGALQWVERAGSSIVSSPDYWDQGRGIGVDSTGNVYVTGGFQGSADFGPFVASTAQNMAFFLAKYNSTGGVQWVRQSAGGNGGADGVYGTGLAVDSAGNSYAVGFADNGATITFGTVDLLNPSVTGYSTFLVKYDNAGTVKWAQLIGGPGHTYATKVAVDTSGNVYVHGKFSMDMTIGANNLVSVGGDDMFLAKFDNVGILQWVRQAGGTEDDSSEGGVAVDLGGNVYVTGAFSSSLMNFGSTSLTNAGSWDAFLAKYSNSGAVQWARRAGGADLDIYWDVALDGQGNVYAAGVLGADAVAPNGTGGAVVAKHDPAGTLQWAYSASGPPADPVGSMVAKCAVDSAGECYLAGWYQGTVTFGTNVLQPQGHWNYFLTKLSPGFDSLQFGSLSVSDGVFQMRLGGAPGASVVVDTSLNLTTWTPWQTNTLPAGGLNLAVPMGTNRQFFRARIP